ncbi:MAG: FAD-dependent monooxygenase [Candidatus Aenigmatarchaeota archaeon]
MKVAIIGAGPVGSWLAGRLAEKGEDVTVFERKKSSGGKACSGLVSERIWNFVEKDAQKVQAEIEVVELHFPRKTVSVRFRPRMLALDRQKLDIRLAKQAKSAGAKILFNHDVTSVRENGGRVRICTGKKEETFDRVIGCDGALSAVRRLFTNTKPRFRAGLQCFQKTNCKGRSADIWPTDNGFFWKIPRGNMVEWGMFGNQETTGKAWREFARKNGLSRLPVQAAVIPEGVQVTGRKNVTLCGDAAGLTKPWSGGGIIWGLTAARLLLDSWPNFPAYEYRLKRMFMPKIAAGRIATVTVIALGNTIPDILPNSFDSDWLL